VWGYLELMLITSCKVAKRENILRDTCSTSRIRKKESFQLCFFFQRFITCLGTLLAGLNAASTARGGLNDGGTLAFSNKVFFFCQNLFYFSWN